MNGKNNNFNLYKEIILKLYRLAEEEDGIAKKLPTLRALAEQFGCTHPTVLRAVRELVETNILIPLKGGGYMTVPRNSGGKFQNIAVIYSRGMNLLDASYPIKIKYHALAGLSFSAWNLHFSQLHAAAYGDIGRMICSGAYNGVVLCSPDSLIIPEVTTACRSVGIPFGIFAGCSRDAGDVSVVYDIKNDFLRVFEKLLEKNRRRMLALSCPGNDWNQEMRNAIGEFSGKFEKAVFIEDCFSNIAEYLARNTGGAGEDFDCAVFVMNIFGIYEQLRLRAPDCLCVMPEFATPYEKNFRGVKMCFDLEKAGSQFAEAMSAVLDHKPPDHSRCFIQCSLEEIL